MPEEGRKRGRERMEGTRPRSQKKKEDG